MKNSLKILTLLMIMAMFAACSKSPGKTSAKLNIISGNFSALLSSKANNGLFFYGRSNDGKVFTKRIDSDSVDLVFPNGTWNFYAISYESGAPTTPPDFTGKTYCGKTTTTFNGTDASLTIDLTNAGCNDPAFSNSVKFMTEYGLPSPTIFTCKNLSGVTGITSCDNISGTSFNKGYATAYRITIYEGKNFGDPVAPTKVADSGCLRTEFSSTAGSLNSTDAAPLANVHIPTNFGNGLNMQLEVFYGSGTPGSNTGCDGSLGVDFVSFADAGRAKPLITSGTSQAYSYELYVKSDAADVCRGPRLGTTNFAAGFGTTGSPYAICTKEQLNLLRTSYSTYRTMNFDLLTDIDYALSSIDPIGVPLAIGGGGTAGNTSDAFTGTLDGRNHKISNYVINCMVPSGTAENNDVGFFRKIGEGAIRNLTINNGIIMCNDGNNIGVLTGQILNSTIGSAIENVRIHGHAEGNQSIGGVAGLVTTTAGGPANFTDVHVKGDFSGKISLGGLAGEYNGGSSSTFSKVSFFGQLNGDHGGGSTPVISKVGGIVGYANLIGSLSITNAVVKAKKIEASTTVGSFVGLSNNVSIQDSYSDAVISANANTDGSATYADAGGAIGNSTGGSFSNVLFIGGLVLSNHAAADHTVGGLVGRLSGTSCGSSSYFTIVNDGAACGSNLTFAAAKTSATFSPVFSMAHRQGSWDVSSDPTGTTLGACSTPDNGKYLEVSIPGSTTAFGASQTTVSGDLAICNGSTWNYVPFSNRATAFSSYTWTMHDDGYDFPRLSYEGAVEDAIDYFRRPCQGHFSSQFGAGTSANPYWICSADQLQSITASTFNVIKNDITWESGYFSPLAGGVYNIAGEGHSLKGIQLQIPSSITSNSFYGMFQLLNPNSNIINFDLIGSSIDTPAQAVPSAGVQVYIGLLAGKNLGTIFNVNIDKSKVYYNSAPTSTSATYAGGAVGLNGLGGLIDRSEIDSTLTIEGGAYSATSATLYAGGLTGKNAGIISGLRSHSSYERNRQCSSNFAVITYDIQEFAGAFIGANLGTVKEVDFDGELRSNISAGGAGSSCQFALSNYTTAFIGTNSGTIQDFKAEPRVWLNMSMNNLSPLIGDPTSGTVTRGFVNLDSSAAFSFIAGQSFVDSAVTWDAATYPTSGPGLPTVGCSMANIGVYSTVNGAGTAGSTANVMNTWLNPGDRIICDGHKNVVVRAESWALLNTSVSSTNLFYTVRDPKGSCSDSTAETQMDCTNVAGSWTPGAASLAVPLDRHYDTSLDYTIYGSNGLSIYDNTASASLLTSAAFTTASDFFHPGLNNWLLNLKPGQTVSNESPDLVKTDGNIDDLGPIFN